MECPDLNDNDLRPIMILGSGSFGKVYLSETESSELLAVKVIDDKLSISPIEVHIQASIENPYIMRLKHISFGDKVTMGMPAAAGDLNILEGLNLEFANKISICRKLIEAVHCLHRNGYIHRDIKPANVLLNLSTYTDKGIETEVYEPVLIDFGLSIPVKSLITGMRGSADVGTACYLPMDVISNNEKIYNEASDIWALGATIYYIITNEQLVNLVYDPAVNMRQKTLDYLKSITQVGTGIGAYIRSNLSRLKGVKIPVLYYDNIVDLIVSSLNVDRNLRPTAMDLLDNQLFSIISTPIYDCIIKEIHWPPENKDRLNYSLIKEKIKTIANAISTNIYIKMANIAAYYWALDIAYRYFSLPYFEDENNLKNFNNKGTMIAIITIGVELTGVVFEPEQLRIYGGYATVKEIGDGIGEVLAAMESNIHRRFLFESIRTKQECLELHRILMDPQSYYNYSPNPVDTYSTISPEDGMMYYSIKDIITCNQ